MKDVATSLEALDAKGMEMQNLLTFSLHFVIGTTLMGVLVIVALTMGYDTAKPILIAAAAGFVLHCRSVGSSRAELRILGSPDRVMQNI